jgi:hypothetical protein
MYLFTSDFGEVSNNIFTMASRPAARRGLTFVTKLLIGYAATITLVIVFPWSRQMHVVPSATVHENAILPRISGVSSSAAAAAASMVAIPEGWNAQNPLAIPKGQAQNLPSIRVKEPNVDAKRKIYGGTGDKKHLGGFTDFDIAGVSPAVWKYMVEKIGVHSVLDVGCGRGVSTMWFRTHGVKTLCVEGSHDAVEHSLLPAELVVEHDFSRGPWWPEDTYSACWVVEFLEHVNVQFQFNYLTAFRKCAVIFATSSVWGGVSHLEDIAI